MSAIYIVDMSILKLTVAPSMGLSSTLLTMSAMVNGPCTAGDGFVVMLTIMSPMVLEIGACAAPPVVGALVASAPPHAVSIDTTQANPMIF
jgi:hypothetical protein